jgi:dUTP pyrophosphatase
MMLPIRIKATLARGAQLPSYASAGASGLDLHLVDWKDRDERGFSVPDEAWQRCALTICPGDIVLVRTGLSVELPEGLEAQVRGRSGLASKHGIAVHNSPGTIDADYRGEIGVMLVHLGSEPKSFQPGERIAQLVVAPVVRVELDVVDALSDTKRGASGYGSTGQ